MRGRDAAELVLLAAIWGGSFLFMRVAAPEFGPVPLMAVRVGVAAAALLPLLALRGGTAPWRGRAWPLLALGVLNSALPFSLLAFATLTVTSGLASILNATSPLWGALVAHLWLRDRLDRSRVAGLLLGLAGVAFLFWGKASFRAGGAGWAVAAALAATLSYGIAASYAKVGLAGMASLPAAAGTQLGATLVLAPLAVGLWPAHPVSARAWGAALLLGLLCTAAAYILYYRLIAAIGPARSIAVTFLIPPFALAWGALLLGEAITPRIVAGAAVVLAGTALATGLVRLPGAPAKAGK